MNPWDKPAAYIVSCIHGDSQAGEAIQNYYSWERVSRVICSNDPDAQQTAQYVMDSGNVDCDWIDIDPELSDDLTRYMLAQELPSVIVVPSHDSVKPGGIVAVYLHDDELVYEPRLGAA